MWTQGMCRRRFPGHHIGRRVRRTYRGFCCLVAAGIVIGNSFLSPASEGEVSSYSRRTMKTAPARRDYPRL